MPQLAPSNQTTIVTHAVLAGLTPLIPIPLIDDLIKNYFRRRMARNLAASHGFAMPSGVADELTQDYGGGCLWGCMTTAVIYPLKAIFRKIFFFLEWKRVVDLTSRIYHEGYLVDVALGEGWLQPESVYRPEEVGRAIHEVCRKTPLKPVEAAVRVAFRQSRRALMGSARMLERQFRRLRKQPNPEQLAQAVEAIEPQEEQELAGVIARVQREIGSVSGDHFASLRAELERHLLVSKRERDRLNLITDGDRSA
jgi:hypothetical protein